MPDDDQTPAANRVTALTLRIGDLREQRDQARAEREASRDEWQAERDEWHEGFHRMKAERDEARERVARCDDLHAERIEALREWRLALAERDEARAQVVACQTAARIGAEGLRQERDRAHATIARIKVLCNNWESSPWVSDQDHAIHLRFVLDDAETDPVSDSSASVDPSATPDLLGPQIGAEGGNA